MPERFWSKVDRTGDCWLWVAHRNAQGYGQFATGGHHGAQVSAHRFAWELTNGPVPDGMFVLHHCDNPPCVRPDHLFLGTQRDNVLDAWSKGRHRTPTLPHGRADMEAGASLVCHCGKPKGGRAAQCRTCANRDLSHRRWRKAVA
jgi:hypothetical protein